MRFPGREEVARIRAKYPAGAKVRLLSMSDPQSPPAGTIGTVLGVDDVATVHIAWSNGSTLGIIDGVDSVVRICPVCGEPLTGHPAISRMDNKTRICSECGTREALSAAGILGEDQEEIIKAARAAGVSD